MMSDAWGCPCGETIFVPRTPKSFGTDALLSLEEYSERARSLPRAEDYEPGKPPEPSMVHGLCAGGMVGNRDWSRVIRWTTDIPARWWQPVAA